MKKKKQKKPRVFQQSRANDSGTTNAISAKIKLDLHFIVGNNILKI